MSRRGMRPDSKASRVLAVLREGPATTSEVAITLGWNSHRACAHLFDLQRRGKVTSTHYMPIGQRRCWLWSVAPGIETGAP